MDLNVIQSCIQEIGVIQEWCMMYQVQKPTTIDTKPMSILVSQSLISTPYTTIKFPKQFFPRPFQKYVSRCQIIPKNCYYDFFQKRLGCCAQKCLATLKLHQEKPHLWRTLTKNLWPFFRSLIHYQVILFSLPFSIFVLKMYYICFFHQASIELNQIRDQDREGSVFPNSIIMSLEGRHRIQAPFLIKNNRTTVLEYLTSQTHACLERKMYAYSYQGTSYQFPIHGLTLKESNSLKMVLNIILF